MYYIYEIKGVKVGCTNDMQRRQYQQRDKGKMVLLETHTNKVEASKRERELQLEKGYPYDGNSYLTQLKLVNIAHHPQVRKRAAKTLSKTTKGKPKDNSMMMTKEARAKAFANTDYMNSTRGLRVITDAKKKSVVIINPEGKRSIVNGVNETARQLSVILGKKIYQGSITQCLRGIQKTVKGYRFEYVK